MIRSVTARRHRRQRRLGGVLMTLVATCFLIIGSGAIYLHFKKTDTDKATGCPVHGYEYITAILVDMTDALNPVQTAALRNALAKVRDETPRYGRLEIYPLRSFASQTLEPLYAGCSPGSGRDVDSSLYGNPQLADRIWSKLFAARVDEVAAALANLPEEQNSPILSAIKSVSVTSFGSPQARNAQRKRLILISDLIEHTSELSMYSGVPDFSKFKDTNLYAAVRPGLRSADIELVVFERKTKNNVQNSRWRNFWITYFESVNSTVTRWVKVEEY